MMGQRVHLSVLRESSWAEVWSLDGYRLLLPPDELIGSDEQYRCCKQWLVSSVRFFPLVSIPPATTCCAAETTSLLNWRSSSLKETCVRLPELLLPCRCFLCLLLLSCRHSHSCCAVGGCGGAAAPAVRLARLSNVVSQRKRSQPLVLPLNWQYVSVLPTNFVPVKRKQSQPFLKSCMFP